MIDIHITVDDTDHRLYRRPRDVFKIFADAGIDKIRSVTVLDRSAGLTSTAFETLN